MTSDPAGDRRQQSAPPEYGTLTAAVDPPDIPHSCPHISYAQAKLRRIYDWAEETGHIHVEQWARAAWNDIENVRSINRALRIAATGKSV